MLGVQLTLEQPRLAAIAVLDDPRRAISELMGQAAFEHVRRLDEVIIHREHQEPATAVGGVRKQSEVTLFCGSCLCLRTHPSTPALVIRIVI
jgi:hypothetical protein